MKRLDVRRGPLGLVVLVTTTLVALGLGASPSAAASGRCAPGTGVTVVVDYGPLGGDVVIGCDPDGAGKYADDVVRAAGFTLEDVHTRPGFVCRVNGQPGTSGEWAEDCGDVPPADRYWGLFWSDADPASWVYSSEGAGSLKLPEGSSIGWRFQDGGTRENPSASPTPQKKTAPQPSANPSPQPSKPPKSAQPSATPTPSASVPPGTEGSSPAPGAAPDGPKEERPSEAGGRDGAKGVNGQGGGKAKGDKGKGDKGKGDKDGKNKKAEDEEAGAEEDLEPSDSTTDAAFEPTSDEPVPDDGSSGALTLVAGGAVLLLAGAAGVIAWRRRV